MRAHSAFFGLAGALFLIASCSSGSSSGGGTGGKSSTGGSKSSTGGSGGGSGGITGTGGGPTCALGKTSCSSVCVDTTNDNQNCGSCGTKCANGQSCASGKCDCSGGLKACGSACVNTASDGSNCGACGTVCTGGQVCSQGQCSSSCQAGETKCEQTQSCANVLADATNCGSCGNKCAAGQGCANGACGCPSGQTTCGGVCVDVSSSAANCGTCGHACTNGQTCSAGNCVGAGSGGSSSGGAGGGSNTGGSGGGAKSTGGAGGNSGGAGGASTGGAGGGSAGGGVIIPGRDCPAKAGLISDFEEGGTTPVVIKNEDRTGEWEIFKDATSGTINMTVESSGGTADCDKYALHVKGSGFTDWGAGFGFSLVGSPKSPTAYNATTHQFTGVRFKAKLGSGHDPKSPLRFNVSTPWTESKENPGGVCETKAATTTKAEIACYQHVGKFLPPGSGDGELSSSWKTYSYCFDRDLYPLSLPSNLSNTQRDTIGTNVLKIQFQFNQGKDYSGGYPSNGQYPVFQKSLPFELWVDDISFFNGDCPSTASPSNGSPKKAFPQSANVGSCEPATNASKFNSAIAQAYARWTKTFVQTDHIVAPEQSGVTTSEAMGYGLLIAAAMGDKAAFDKFHKYVQDHGGKGSGGLMTWSNTGSGSATDGDEDIAYALLMADAQWGGYKTFADDMIAAILSKDIVSGTVSGGSDFHQAPFNPSYFAPAAYRKFTGFAQVISTGYTMLNKNVSAPTAGIPTDWGGTDGTPSDHGAAQVVNQLQSQIAFGYDGARVPWRIGLDVCTGGTDKTALTSIVSFFAAKYDAGATIDLLKAGWDKSSGNVDANAKDFQGSFIGPMGVGGMAVGNAAVRDRAFRTILDILENGDFNHTYFPSTVGLLTALMMSGNYPVP